MTNPNQIPLSIVDSSVPVNSLLVDQVKNYLNQMPVAWGRYFTTGYPVEYSHKLENNILHDNNIKLLPIARHTNHVGGSAQQGKADAIQGVNDLFATFGIDYWKSQGSEFFFFLDVEGNPTGANGSISEEYYEAWSETLVSESQAKSGNALTILPCVYANHQDDKTFSILLQNGLACHGLWIARYHNSPQRLPAWDETFAVPSIVKNSSPSIHVFLRQYAAGYQIGQEFDLDQTNPNIQNIQEDFLNKLILPPANPSA